MQLCAGKPGRVEQDRNRDRIKSALGVAAIHALIGYALIAGFGVHLPREASDTLKLFDVSREPPPPPLIEKPIPAPQAAKDPEGAAAPPGLKAQPAPIVAPPPMIRLVVPPPVIAAPVAGVGAAPSAGASEIAGPGPGAGGEGTGTGSGRAGSGSGGGGVAVRARHRQGRIVNADYPRAAGDAGAQGAVTARFTVEPDGRVTGCTIVRSSGNPDLDATTCRLIEARFRYDPARDADGQPVADVMGWNQDWWIGSRKRR